MLVTEKITAKHIEEAKREMWSHYSGQCRSTGAQPPDKRHTSFDTFVAEGPEQTAIFLLTLRIDSKPVMVCQVPPEGSCILAIIPHEYWPMAVTQER